jgi:hypothetical protein
MTVISSAIFDRRKNVMKITSHITGAEAEEIAVLIYRKQGTNAANISISEMPDKILASSLPTHRGK